MPNIQGVILIDVWHDPNLGAFYRDVVDRLRAFDIRCCVNASYNLDLRGMVNSQDRSFLNTLRLHLWDRPAETQLRALDDLNASDRLVFNTMRFSRSDYRTDPLLATPDLLASDASVMVLDPDDLVHHCRRYHNNSIKDWLVVGQSWGMCVHGRPMGLYNLARLSRQQGYNFFVAPWGVLDSQGQTLEPGCFDGSDKLPWKPVKDFGYRLAV